MKIFSIIALLHLPSIAVSLKSHLSGSGKLKCDSLPYRTSYVDDKCYFAVLQEIDFSKSTKKCSSILFGAKVALDVPAGIFGSMMVDKLKFHLDDDSTGAKYLLCAYESSYKCDSRETLLTNGRCLVRAPRKMHYVEAKSYCEERGMDIPAPANDLDNRIVRGEAKFFTRDSGYKWSQPKSFTKWATCDQPLGHKPRLYTGSQNDLWSCKADIASVVDGTGYWSNAGSNYSMEVICIKDAVNEFTKAELSCNYHELNDSVEEVAFPEIKTAITARTCYSSTRATTRYSVIGRAKVETQRGCEVLCDSKTTCIAFSYKEAGSSSSCVLLATSSAAQTCAQPAVVFLKKTNGLCGPVCTNISAGFGDDPCIDSMIPITRGLNQRGICPLETPDGKHTYIIRAIDVRGRRITVDNDGSNWLECSNDVWVIRYDWRGKQYREPVVSAVCALAGDQKCPCEKPYGHFKLQPESAYEIAGAMYPSKPTFAAAPNVLNPCQGKGWLAFEINKFAESSWHQGPLHAVTEVNCHAGMWILWSHGQYQWGVNALCCLPV